MSAFDLPPPSPYLDDVIYEQPLVAKLENGAMLVFVIILYSDFGHPAQA